MRFEWYHKWGHVGCVIAEVWEISQMRSSRLCDCWSLSDIANKGNLMLRNVKGRQISKPGMSLDDCKSAMSRKCLLCQPARLTKICNEMLKILLHLVLCLGHNECLICITRVQLISVCVCSQVTHSFVYFPFTNLQREQFSKVSNREHFIYSFKPKLNVYLNWPHLSLFIVLLLRFTMVLLYSMPQDK
jgi:hypothetical protein